MLARDLALALDPSLLMEVAGIEPDPWQRRFLRSASKKLILLCSRQSGKSTVSASLALWHALYREDLVLLLSPSLRQSQELFRKVMTFYRTVDHSVPSEEESSLRLELANGSRIVSLPGKEGTVRGFSGVGLIVVDEAARVPDDLYYAVRPMLAVSGGRLVALSTPWGKRGWFFKEWSEGQGWDRFRITADQCPRISRVFLEEERRSLGDWWFKQEYLCEFVDTVDQVFTYDQVVSAVTTGVKPLFGGKNV